MVPKWLWGWLWGSGSEVVVGVVVRRGWLQSGCGGGCERGVVTEWLWGWL